MELLADLISVVLFRLTLDVAFAHARWVRKANVQIEWFKIRLLGAQQMLWLLVAHDSDRESDLVLVTNFPIHSPAGAQAVYTQWRDRPHIEHTYRFDQKEGFDIEDVRV